MKTLKSYLFIFTVMAVIFSASLLKADNISAANTSDLRIHIYKELVDILKSPVWLNFQNKNLKGETEVAIFVSRSGKIVLKSVNGENQVLNNMITHKFNSLNIWTATNFADQSFNFKVVSK
ncbi:MAG: hypothetical protein WC139_10300 [Candidatus Kapaibacterium sp.]